MLRSSWSKWTKFSNNISKIIKFTQNVSKPNKK